MDVTKLTRLFAQVQRGLSDMSPVMAEIGEAWLASTQDRVLAGLTPQGTSFAPRSQTTIDRYNAIGLGFGAPLNQSGIMRQGIFYDSGADYAAIASNAIQAAVMQFGAKKGAFGTTSRGGSIPWGNIPARPFLGFSESDQSSAVAKFTEWLEKLDP